MKPLARGNGARRSPVNVDAGLDVGSGFRTGLVESRWVVVVSGKLTLAVSVALVGGSL